MKNKPPVIRNALAAAFAMLARRPHSRAQLQQKLERKGYADAETASCLQRLAELGYLNDADVARRWAHTMVQERCWGRMKIARQLQQRGIERELAAQVLDEIRQACNESDVARRALEKRFGGSVEPLPAKKIVSFLRARGFAGEAVYEVLREWTQEEEYG